MLIKFSFSNFKSIKEEQCIDLTASNYEKNLKDNLNTFEIPSLKEKSILKGIAIYGANASGKSNVLEAVGYMRNFVLSGMSDNKQDESIDIPFFKLDSKQQAKPTEFKVEFTIDNIRYKYEFSLNSKQVLYEKLSSFPKGVERVWFLRTWNETGYQWGPKSRYFKLKSYHKEVVDSRKNILFLSVSIELGDNQLKPVYEWFKNSLKQITLSAGRGISEGFTAELMMTPGKRSNSIKQIMKSVDFCISEIKAEEKELEEDDIKKFDFIKNFINPKVLEAIEKEPNQLKKRELTFIHKNNDDEPVEFDFNKDESVGTQRFFALIGPWLDILENGHTVLIDEIDTSLHPILVREMLKLLFSKKYNKKGAQVIFTTHNPLLLDSDLLRRDQIWFTEKTSYGETFVYPLTEYKPRKNEAIAKGYISGRYGAIPYIPDGLVYDE